MINSIKIHRTKSFGWIRIFGIGLYWKNTKTHRQSFTERNGIKKTIKFNNWIIATI